MGFELFQWVGVKFVEQAICGYVQRYIFLKHHCICLWHVEEWLYYCLLPFSVFLFMGGDAELCFRFSRGR
jgi:hypothetical protein